MAILGLLMFLYPGAWARGNALLARKDIQVFNSEKQLAHTKRIGLLMLIFAGFSILSLLAMSTLVPLK